MINALEIHPPPIDPTDAAVYGISSDVALLLSAVDDPFLPSDVLNDVRHVAASNRCIEIEFPASGGHVGFVSGHNPLRPFYYAEWRVTEFLEHAVAAAYDPVVGALRSGAT